METEKRRIMNMDFRTRSDKDDWEKLNRFLQEKQNINGKTEIPKQDLKTSLLARDTT